MDMTSTGPRTFVSMPVAEKALLTYQAISQSDDVIILIECTDGAPGADALIVGLNEAFRRTSGYSDKQLLGCKTTDLFLPGNEIDRFGDAIRACRSFRAELACIRADGSTFMLGLHLMPAPARSAGQNCFVVLGRDITELLRIRQTQDSIQRLLAKVFVCVDDAMSIVDSGGSMLMTNPAFNRLLGYKPNEVVGRRSLDLVASESRASVAASIKQQLADKCDMTYAAAMLRADGSEVIVRVTSVLVPLDDKQFRILTLRSGNDARTNGMRTQNAGRINLIGLDEVRAALGDRWEAVAARAMESAEVVLKRRCGRQDSFSRADDTSFVVCFGGLSEQEASFRAAMIGREIRDRLIGQGENPDTAFVRAIAASVRLPAKDYGSASQLHTALLDGMDKQLARIEEEARETLRAGWASPTSQLQPISGRDRTQTIANDVRFPGEVEQRLMIALSVLPRKESQSFDLDALLLGLAAQQAISTMGQGISLPLLVKVRFDVFFTSASTERFLVTCRKIDPRVSSRLVLMLSELPAGLPKSRLLECVTRLRSFCCAVGYYANDLAAAETIDLSNSFNPIVAIPFNALSAKDADRLKQTIASLQARRAKVLIHKVTTEKNAAGLRSLGADMIVMEDPSTRG